ncbi:MAG: GNAT family protein [Pseudomonadota bacterium]
MTVTIRPAEGRDLEGIFTAIASVAAEARWLARTEALPRETLETLMATLAPQSLMQVAAQGDQIIGWCDIAPNPRPPMAHRGELGMGLVAESRGRGIGGRLLRATLSAADRAGLQRIDLSVFTDNLAGIALYERHGFAREGVRPDGWRHEGVSRDILNMGRLIAR